MKKLAKETLVDVFWNRVSDSPEKPAILHKVMGEYRPVIWREHGKVVELACGGLLKLGVGAGQKVAIMSSTRPEWTWADLAILSCGAVSVPIYPTLAPPEVQYLLQNSDAVGIFVENLNQLAKLSAITQLSEKVGFAVVMDGVPDTRDARFKTLAWSDLLKESNQAQPKTPEALTRTSSADRHDGLF